MALPLTSWRERKPPSSPYGHESTSLSVVVIGGWGATGLLAGLLIGLFIVGLTGMVREELGEEVQGALSWLVAASPAGWLYR